MKYKKVLIIIPPSENISKDYLPNLGVLYLAAVLEKNDIKVKVIDMGLKTQQENITFDFDLVCITSVSDQRFRTISLLESLFKELPKIPVVLGGVHFTYTREQTMKTFPNVIEVVQFEGENKLLQICKGEPVTDTPVNLDELPWPARELVPMESYSAKLEGENETRCTSIVTSRGCPNNCVFCANKSYWKQKCRFRNPIDVVNEIEYIIDRYDIRGFDIWDDTFTISRKHVETICKEIIERGLDIKFYARVRVNTIDKRLLTTMKNAGCVAISYGVESGSEKVVKAVHKNITFEQVDNVSKWCQELGLYAKAFFMINLPEENVFDVIKTARYMKKLNNMGVSTPIGITTVYPGTDLDDGKTDWNNYFSELNMLMGLDPKKKYYKRWRIPFYYLIWRLFK